MTGPVVSVRDVHKGFRLYHERNVSLKSILLRGKRSSFEVYEALKGVSFEVEPGQTFGLLGGNGSGKSTMLKCIAGILVPDAGSITTRGRVASLLELGSGFHPELSGRDNVYLNASILGLSRKETAARFDDIVDFSGIREFIDSPVKNYSSGMYVRLGFSVAIHILPDLFLVDEVLAVGDEQFQRRCAEKFGDLQREGTTIVLVTHSMAQVRDLCDGALWLDKGTPRAIGDAATVVSAYLDEQDRLEASHEVVAAARVTLRDGAGRDATDVPSGSEITAHVEADLVQPRERVRVKLELLDGRGVPILDGRSDVPVSDGRVTTEVRVPALPLRAGEYVVRASIEAEGQHRPVSASTHFLVGGGGSPSALLATSLDFRA
ncbi:MAG TPA: polysaccharide ABC transporter ATP-binding protein [Intrasporangium sp.]|uniref:ABC transporter ATP-binding protein n=1 Tax=Intrasporangium sp. TaxID=1925024 RepID=UPI002D767D63|nr:polysaccharide ABC transporter ATP-binding protein [Intrasporangium sp.]HET7399937.1 polysaccharide ABC transporter ATP-binding protein [Intrasporangium sp.]